jgi:hypothetical protein
MESHYWREPRIAPRMFLIAIGARSLLGACNKVGGLEQDLAIGVRRFLPRRGGIFVGLSMRRAESARHEQAHLSRDT